MEQYNNWAYRTLRKHGWSIRHTVEIPDKCVICVAPHTSNWDFVLGMLYKIATKLKANFFMKHEWFYFPLGCLMRKLGGIPVYRDKKSSLTDQMAEEFSRHSSFHVAITPEGTRKRNPDWKKGFYFIALKANVPIVLAYLDYKEKVIGLGSIIIPTEDIETNMLKIKDFYKNVQAKHPAYFAI